MAVQPGSNPVEAIQTDLERTFADMPMVAPRKPQIFRILQQYAIDNPDIGYTQGMNYVAATMVLKFPDREDLAKRRFAEAMLQFNGFWSDNFPLLNFGVQLFARIAEQHLQALWGHLIQSGVEPLSYLPNGWLSLFGKWLPLPAVMESMDLVLECGIRGVLAVTLAIFQIRQNRLMSARGMEHLLELINQERLRATSPLEAQQQDGQACTGGCAWTSACPRQGSTPRQDMRTSPLDGDLIVKCARVWIPKVDATLQATCPS